jgi:hypothetical protein
VSTRLRSGDESGLRTTAHADVSEFLLGVLMHRPASRFVIGSAVTEIAAYH